MRVVAVPDDGLTWGRGGAVGQAQPPPHPYPDMTASDVRVVDTRRNCITHPDSCGAKCVFLHDLLLRFWIR